MEIGFVGLGKMGKNMSFRLLEKGHKVVGWDMSNDAIKEVVTAGAVGASSIEDLCKKLKAPRIVWVMVPCGAPVDDVISKATPHLQKGDLIIDGGNSRFTDSARRHKELAPKGIRFLDIGTSGGLAGAKTGYCFMAGGEADAYKMIEPYLQAMAVPEGYLHAGPAGAGHYVKMVHNAIEYGMMQAIGEGMDMLENGTYKGKLDLARVSDLWSHGSIIRGLLIELTANALKKDPHLSKLAAHVDDSGEGRWASIEAIDHAVPFVVNSYAVHARFASRQTDSFAMKTLAALRNEFGGHAVKEKK